MTGVAPRSGPRLRWWLLGANLFVLLAPLVAVVGLRLYDTLLVRQTERQLIAQSVLIGEAWREQWLAARRLGEPPPFRPPARAGDQYVPVEPVTDLASGVEPPQPADLPECAPADAPTRRAGRSVEPLLQRMQVFNLSAARVLDGRGCVVATSRGELGRSLAALPEVAAALGGRYSAVARQRVTDDPLPPLSDVRSRGAIRIFTALPVFSDGDVVAVVRMSRTSLDALTTLWHSRRGLLVALGATGFTALLVSLVFGALIARPLRLLAGAADVVAQGGTAPLPEPSRVDPVRGGVAAPVDRDHDRAAARQGSRRGPVRGRRDPRAEGADHRDPRSVGAAAGAVGGDGRLPSGSASSRTSRSTRRGWSGSSTGSCSSRGSAAPPTQRSRWTWPASSPRSRSGSATPFASR